jgi:HlyD family secretion protein
MRYLSVKFSMTLMVRCGALALLASVGLLACSAKVEEAPPLEIVRLQSLELSVAASGELRSAKSTPLVVPGTQFAQRQLLWMRPEGSAVKAGEVVARFSAARGEVDLAEARVNLMRNALTRAGKEAELGAGEARIDADLSQVDTDLRIADRYASADLSMIARNELLDAVQDREFLGSKQDFLSWKRDQTGERGAAELAVLDSQRQSQTLLAKTREEDLAALEITAPHDGVLMLSADWSGEKPRVGATLWAGNDFGNLPDARVMEAQFALTQLDAAGVKVGAQMELSPLGRPDLKFPSSVAWVAAAAQPTSRGNPIKYLRIKADIPADQVERLLLVPGQTLAAKIFAAQAEQALSVANVAVISEGAQTMVELWRDGSRQRVAVTLGERGLARSQVLDGLKPGDAVVLTPDRERRS